MLLALLWLLLLALWLLLHWLILPNLDRWRPELETQASKALGLSVQIAHLQVKTGGWMPEVELRDVRLRDPQGREGLHLPRVQAALSARSLLAWPPRLEQLYIHEPDLTLRRDAQGRLWVAGLQVQASDAGGPDPFADWLLRQYELAVRGGRIRWVDETRAGAAPLQLQQVDLLLRNTLRRHELRVDATPPAALGQRVSLRARVTQPLLGRPSDWKRWSGSLYAELPQTAIGALREHLQLPVALARGQGSLRLWSELDRGALSELTLDLGLRDVRLRITPEVDALELASLSTRIGWQRRADGTRWSLRGLQFALPKDAGGEQWPASEFSLSLRHAAVLAPWQLPTPAQLQGGQLQADRVDLGLLARLAGSLPLGEAINRQLADRAPQGRLLGLEARWEGALSQLPRQWSVRAQAEQLRLQPLPAPEPSAAHPHPLGQPGFDKADVRLAANERGGEARLSLRDGSLQWPGLLESGGLQLRQASTELRWQRSDTGWQLRWPQLLVETPDIQLRGDGQWQTNGRPGGQIELRLRAPQAQVKAVPKHLPLWLADTRRYLSESLLDGQLRDLRLELKGPLADFPFRHSGQGVFKLGAQLQNGRYAYLPSHPADATRPAYQSPWPELEQLRGELRFEGPLLRILAKTGRSAGLELQEVEARIEGLGLQPLVRVNGRWRGDASQALAFVRQTPINRWTGEALAQAQGSGPVSGSLQLAIPLAEPAKAQVQGQVQLGQGAAGLQLRLRPDLPPFAQLRGPLSYTEKGVQLQRLQARFLGGELRLGGGSRPDGSLLFEADGQASADGLRDAAREWPVLATLGPQLSGQAAYQLRLAFKGAQPELELRSSLQGLGAALPEPLAKSAEASLPLLLRVQPQAGGREVWGLSLGTAARALIEREGGRALRGAIRIGSDGPLPLPAQGLQLVWAAPRIDLDPWRRLNASRPSGAASTAGDGDAWLPDQLLLQTPQLRLAGRWLQQVELSAQRAANRRDWSLRLQAKQASGDAEWRQPPGQPPQLQLRLARLQLPEREAEQVESWLDETSSHSALPMLDLQVDAFELRGRSLGKLVIKADGAAAGRDWTLQQLSLSHPDASLRSQGVWRAAEGRTQLDWQLDIANSGRWLDALGFTNTVRGGKGQLKGSLSWRGSPLSPSSRGLDGQFSVALDQGQFLKADPGVARLLGILSLQSLPRRLLFDWRDVFSGGFAFDEFAGDVSIHQGVASSSNLRMRGLQANVLMEGSADLGAETTDLRVLVVPNLDAGGATLAYTAINPAVGLTTFLAQWLLRKPIEAANTTHLRVSGPWADPKVEKVERAAAAANPGSPS